MLADELIAKAQATYAALKRDARERFPLGHYFAMAGGKIVADDGSEQGVRQRLRSLGLREQDTMVEQVRNESTEPAIWPGWITFTAMAGHLVHVMTPGEQST